MNREATGKQRLTFTVALEERAAPATDHGGARSGGAAKARKFMVSAHSTSDAELRDLLRREFDLQSSAAISLLLPSEDGTASEVIAPVQVSLIDDNHSYRLRVYEEDSEKEKELSDDSPLWASCRTTDGREYYYNTQTRDTTWVKPESLKTVKLTHQVTSQNSESLASAPS